MPCQLVKGEEEVQKETTIDLVVGTTLFIGQEWDSAHTYCENFH